MQHSQAAGPSSHQIQPLLHEAGPSGQAGVASRLLEADDQCGSGIPPLSLGLPSLGSSPEMGLTRSDQQRPYTILWGGRPLAAEQGPGWGCSVEVLGWKFLGVPGRWVPAHHHPHATGGGHSEWVVSLPSHVGRGVQNPHPSPRLPDPGTTSASPGNRRRLVLKTMRCGCQGSQSILACCWG